MECKIEAAAKHKTGGLQAQGTSKYKYSEKFTLKGSRPSTCLTKNKALLIF